MESDKVMWYSNDPEGAWTTSYTPYTTTSGTGVVILGGGGAGGPGSSGTVYYDDVQAVRRDAIQRVRDAGIFEPPPVVEEPKELVNEMEQRFRGLDL